MPSGRPTSPPWPPATEVLVTVRRGKTTQQGEPKGVRFVKGGVARALRTLRAVASPAPEDRVVPLWWGCGSVQQPAPPASST